ncbi:MAG: DUF1573 domain-containing protein [Pirellulaceae bacterium]
MIRDPFLRRVVIATVVFIPIATSMLALAMTVTYKPFGVPDLKREAYEQKIADIHAANEALAKGDDATLPKAVVPESVHDFGMMDPLCEAMHSFDIRNEGDAPLVLTGGSTSCKCTLMEGGTQVIDPGESSKVTLFWNSGRKQDYYEQNASIRANDPLMPEINLKIRGKVRFEVGTSVDEVNFVNLQPDGEGTFELDVFSQLFYEFDIQKIQSTLEDLVWTVEPLDAETLRKRQARSGFRLHLRMPTKNVDTLFSGVLRLWIDRPEQPLASVNTDLGNAESTSDRPIPESDGGDPLDAESDTESILREIPVRGRIPRRLVLFGEDLNTESGLQMGIMPSGKPYEKRLVLRCRGEKQPEVLKIGNVEPEIVSAKLEPMQREGYYTVIVSIPENAPMTIFNTPQSQGRLEIESDVLPSGKMVVPLIGAIVE